jgi:hypothetical protein
LSWWKWCVEEGRSKRVRLKIREQGWMDVGLLLFVGLDLKVDFTTSGKETWGVRRTEKWRSSGTRKGRYAGFQGLGVQSMLYLVFLNKRRKNTALDGCGRGWVGEGGCLYSVRCGGCLVSGGVCGQSGRVTQVWGVTSAKQSGECGRVKERGSFKKR